MKKASGQISIFLVLIFNVLFVFFAMVINVGLLVHDKINLQNSLDLATYYAASKQAQVLSAIGHSNYQIRQSWKLLTFRLRVLGEMGRTGHPLYDKNTPLVERQLPNPTGRTPSVCIGMPIWSQNPDSGQNLCASEQIQIPRFPELPIIWPMPGNFNIANINRQYQNLFSQSCRAIGLENWALAAQWYIGYRLDIASRKKIIRAMAKQLSSRSEDFLDLEGQSVREGVLNTLKNNLTRGNLEGLKDADVEIYNSLGVGEENWTRWLNEIFIFPKIVYTDIFSERSSGCSGDQKTLNHPNPWNIPANTSDRSKIDPSGFLFTNRFEPGEPKVSNPFSLYHSSLGYEKNPWFMAYVGVKVKTTVRKPFSPFSKPVEVVARAFAKPFGARIGPWVFNQWHRGASRSQGSRMTDPLVPLVPQDENDKPTDKNFSVPNYSRFPGDTLGYNSIAALGAFRDPILKYGNVRTLTRQFWGNLPSNLEVAGGDILAYSLMPLVMPDPYLQKQFKNPVPWIRSVEQAAIAPDLFDATYYPIEPSFSRAYLSSLKAWMPNQKIWVRSDIGARDPEENGITPFLNIEDQISVLNSIFGTADQVPSYYIKNPAHLLTSWVPIGAYEYSDGASKPNQFGICQAWGKQLGAPGCGSGGRSSYSVKIISKSYLNSQIMNLGGEGGSEQGPIMNPPPQNF